MNLIYKFRTLLMCIATPIGRFISKFHRPPSKITSEHYERALKYIQDGDTLLSRDDWAFSNWFIPGYWKHVGIYYNGYVYEAVTAGVRCIRFDEWMYKKDYVGIVRPNINFTVSELQRGFSFLVECISDEDSYDFTMSMDDLSEKTDVDMGSIKAWYCSKYCYAFYKSMNSSFTDQFVLKETLGEPTVTPNDYWEAVSKFKRVALFNV